MKTAIAPFFALLLLASSAMAQSNSGSSDPNAMPQGPLGTSRASPNGDAQGAYEQAKADCRKETHDGRHDCIKQSETAFDRTLPNKAPLGAKKPTLTPAPTPPAITTTP